MSISGDKMAAYSAYGLLSVAEALTLSAVAVGIGGLLGKIPISWGLPLAKDLAITGAALTALGAIGGGIAVMWKRRLNAEEGMKRMMRTDSKWYDNQLEL